MIVMGIDPGQATGTALYRDGALSHTMLPAPRAKACASCLSRGCPKLPPPRNQAPPGSRSPACSAARARPSPTLR